MKFLQVIFVGVCFILLLSSSPVQKRSSAGDSKVEIPYPEDFEQFLIELDTLISICSDFKEGQTERIRLQIGKTRLAYKKLEFILDYFHTKYNALYINGGPVYKIDEDNPERDPVPPNGLQALDELIFGDDVLLNMPLIDSLAHALGNNVRLVGDSNTPSTIEAGRLIETLKSGILRVFALGVTGFDTPGSGNGIQESIVAMKRMLDYFRLLKPGIIPPQGATNFNEIESLFLSGINQLDSAVFDSFDRMQFLKNCINPLYKALGQFVSVNEIPGVRYKNHGQNYDADNLFDPEFMDSEYFQQFSYQSLNNPKSILLGKTLFYDPILSRNLKMSCATCHDPNKAFTDGLPTSKTNAKGVFLQRNTPGLIDVTYSKRYFHDLRSSNLERQIPHVFESEEEFNMSFREVIDRLNESSTYRKMFSEAYEGIAYVDDINQRSISNALAAYVSSLVSFNSRFDQYVRGETTVYPESAIRGFNLFMGKAACGTCHFPPAFNGTVPPFYTDSESEVLGVPMGFDTVTPKLDPDLGRFSNGKKWEHRPYLKHSFKTPGLRNIELTGPYMHNGSFKSLEEVMDFYNRGGGAGLGLDIDNQTLSSDPLDLSKQEINDVISFLQTLTDTSGMDPGRINLPEFEYNQMWDQR